MTPELYPSIAAAFQAGTVSFARLMEMARAAGSKWSDAQLRLFLACLDGVEIALEANGHEVVRVGQRTEHEALASLVEEMVAAANGKPLHPTEIRQRLPQRFVTTDEQIRALARKTPALEVFGPGLIRLRK